MSVSIISLSSTRGQTKANNFAFSYFTLSAATSFLSYLGCFFIYLTIQTLNINAAVFLLKAEGVGVLASNPAFTVGVLFIIIKLMFLLGLYPFNHYVLEVSNVANYGFLFFFLVVAKFPAILILLNVFKLA
jgi:NADH:ubiquinone oxidoreductase subunit 2 (subunit N)